ncbi:hypothetical protein [Paenibacillus sambharensis]|uniref:hypothetical protein n=1 Tax=Paenibacillus sambharensis TaxID=1803190 RepID=UPI0015E87DFF|nr:hypothetical protein [Paenibacillus sambharensis]
MDKRKVIAAYRRGMITIHECAQILGLEAIQVTGMIEDLKLPADPAGLPNRQPISGC